MACEDATHLVHEFLDHELPEDRHAALREHVEFCPACWRKFEFEKELRSLLWKEGQAIKAPSYLKERVTRTLFNTGDQQPRKHLRQWMVPKLSWGWGTALLLCVGTITGWLLLGDRNSASPLLTELVGDHIRYAFAEKPSELISSNAEEIGTWLEKKLGYSIVVPHFQGPDLQLLGGRFLSVRGKRVAYLIYRDGDHMLSLYVAKVPDVDLCNDNRLQLQDCRLCLAAIQNCEFCLTEHDNYNVLSWRENDITYAMISDLDGDHMLDVTCPAYSTGQERPS